ncbi:DUF1127 domain-containing protein [Neorhizobium galegae]|uniref:YjiS-like domain-containing protein n=1 Tax=Neorhizobium galegae bv. orientalis str. HAMBI 540 TaxID=1028800 RepID=A0A068SRS7_NEOGA|nr:DUF1127 domain-containing protein [Neorhizobium galegae]CDN49007.1 Hypothetical protein RG540_CH28410 [Neorhizobium galegae bv. orientalis str. HAMBI 540]CDZ50674.1 Hypothetical protein NGAL_HAMBI2427_37810 [Neorhizobium galegae bv. orientalis]
MKNENRAVFDRASERYHLVLELSPAAEHQPPAADVAPTKPSLLRRLVAGIVRTFRRHRNRLALLELTDDQLKDIGVSRSQAYGEISRYRRSNAHNLERKCL